MVDETFVSGSTTLLRVVTATATGVTRTCNCSTKSLCRNSATTRPHRRKNWNRRRPPRSKQRMRDHSNKTGAPGAVGDSSKRAPFDCPDSAQGSGGCSNALSAASPVIAAENSGKESPGAFGVWAARLNRLAVGNVCPSRQRREGLSTVGAVAPSGPAAVSTIEWKCPWGRGESSKCRDGRKRFGGPSDIISNRFTHRRAGTEARPLQTLTFVLSCQNPSRRCLCGRLTNQNSRRYTLATSSSASSQNSTCWCSTPGSDDVSGSVSSCSGC